MAITLSRISAFLLAITALLPVTAQSTISNDPKRMPRQFAGGADLPNGWHLTPAGKTIATVGDLVMNAVLSPDGKSIILTHGGGQQHGLNVIDTATQKLVQDIKLPSAYLGLAWSGDGKTLYASGGNNIQSISPIYEFSYANGRLSEQPVGKLIETGDPKLQIVYWMGLAYSPAKNMLYAANKRSDSVTGQIVVFDANTRQIVTRISVENAPYQLLLSPDGRDLYVSNWASDSISIIDTATNTVIHSARVGENPNAMALSTDGRLFVACSNDNTVYVLDARKFGVIERISTTQTPLAPEGSTPNALVIDNARHLLYVANADNNSLAVVRIGDRGHSEVAGFIPTGWYPSALALSRNNKELYIGTAKGELGHANPKGLHSPLADGTGYQRGGEQYIVQTQTGSVELLPVANLQAKLPTWTRQVVEDTPYNDSLLSEARSPQEPSIIPQQVGAESPIKHVIYILKENRTYDQVFGDLPYANGDPRLTIFGEKVTPNQHALAKEYVTLDNLYCDGEVSVDGHSWSDAAYATDFNEKQWPAWYGKHSVGAGAAKAGIPSAGYLWDLAKRKGLTYRSYGEDAGRVSTRTTAGGTTQVVVSGATGLIGHSSIEYKGWAGRDRDNVSVFLKDLKDAEYNYDSPDPEKRLPNFIVMSIPHDHTAGTAPGQYTPQAMVAENDYAIGQLVEGVSHSKYWPNTAIFIIEDDAQDGADHVDARRTVGLVISPYVKRGIVDSTLYSTSSMVRSIELLLGLPPMSQYDAAAMPMYASFGTKPMVTPFNVIKPQVDIDEKNTAKSIGAAASSRMDFSQRFRAPMRALNEIIWKSIKGKDSVMPAPVHRFRPLVDVGDDDDDR
jgi:YVTN family beta-propeller protein